MLIRTRILVFLVPLSALTFIVDWPIEMTSASVTTGKSVLNDQSNLESLRNKKPSCR